MYDEEIINEEEVYSETDDVKEVSVNEEVDSKEVSNPEELDPDTANDDEEVVEGTPEIIFDTFCVRSSQGVSINSVNFCRGKYRLGQLVGTMIINEDIRDNILSLDAQSIATNPHLAV